MSKEFNKLIYESIPSQEKANKLIGRLFDVTTPEAVFSKPVVQGEYSLITASEVTVVMGAGYGGGAGVAPQANATEGEDKPDTEGLEGIGSGGGGGGTAAARPVAAISIGPNGVHVEPIVDPTKIALAFFTAFGAMFLSLSKMRRGK